MWTNVFKIRGFHHVSWFQFLPFESDLHLLSDKRSVEEQSDVDAASVVVLSSHLQLQKEGFFSTWTNSFVGPWDPSQGSHNPDEKLKLWLFLPGHHSVVVETALSAVSRLKVVAYGLWSAPGDSEEVACALSQALRNRIERSLTELSYMRFGDVFSRFRPYSQNDELFSRGQPTIEFIFAASEDAIFVHAIISAKNIRALSSSDIERLSNHSDNYVAKIPVIVSPHGMCGRLTGCCQSDLVKQVYFSSGKFTAENDVIGLPNQVSQHSGCQLRGQSCYVEVTLGCPSILSKQSSNPKSINFQKSHTSESQTGGRGNSKGSPEFVSLSKRIFIYPTETVLIPILQVSSARSSLKRFWLQNWLGPSLSGSSLFMHGSDFTSSDKLDGMNPQWGYNSSNNSNSSSISSISSSSSESDYKINRTGDLEADADSLTCQQSGLTSSVQLKNNSKLGSKRPRAGMDAAFGQVINIHAQDAYRPDFGSGKVNDSDTTGVSNEQIECSWDWDDDDRGMVMDIQALLSEFGDFGDFFENDVLPFGEPPGTAESQILVYPAPDCEEAGSSPCTGVMDVSDQMFMPVGFSSLESFNPPLPIVSEFVAKNDEPTSNVQFEMPVSYTTASSTSEVDYLIKAEAMMTFAPEYAAVEAPTSELFSSIFKSPYLPKSRKSEIPDSSTKSYVYGAIPPYSPCLHGSDDMPVMPSKQYYACTEDMKGENNNASMCNRGVSSRDLMPPSPFSGINSINSAKSSYGKATEGASGEEHFLLDIKTVLATEVECIRIQAYMCRIRHIISSSNGPIFSGLSRLPEVPITLTKNITSKCDVKKESIPIRIADEINGGMQNGPFNAPVGVWRTVGGPKLLKHANSTSIENYPSVAQNKFNEEVKISYGQRQPLQELLNGLALLVQQATSFVDVSLDADYGDGIYGWLALQEQWRRGLSCGPSMVHAGCGGTLASCHSLDSSGMELVDPLSANIVASSAISLLQSDVKTALKFAFGSIEGPLSAIDWCKGHNQCSDTVSGGDGISSESTVSECRDSSSTPNLSVGEPMSPSQSSAGGSSRVKASVDEVNHLQQLGSRVWPTLFILPLPAILVGYQDDWLKTSASSVQLWEKAPFEPYSLQKPMTYYVICPDIDPLTSAAADFFHQLGTVYEACKLGTHSPQSLENQMEIDLAKPFGFIPLDCQSMKIDSSNATLVGSISDYFLSLSNGWDLTSFLKTLSRALIALKLGSLLTTNAKDVNNGPCTVIYVVCPFSEPTAILQTVVESSVAIGSTILSSDKARSILHIQAARALSCSAAVDEASVSNIITLSGFGIPKLVLQIITVDSIFRVTSPGLNELVLLKEIAFTVYGKARRICRGASNDVQSSSLVDKSHSVLMQMTSPSLGMWKESVGPRITGSSLQRENELEPSSRPVSWDNSWQTPRTRGLDYDPNRLGELLFHEETHYMFEPLFILAEPGSLEHAVSSSSFGALASDSSKVSDESSSINCQVDGSDPDGQSHQKNSASIHCCYGWTEDWRWLVCIWTDSRGELLDSHIFPFGGISSRQDTKGMQCLFVQVLQQGCQMLQACFPDSGSTRQRNFVITRIGCFYELECQEWQKAIYFAGGSDVKKWPLQLRRSVPDANGTSLHQQEMGLIQERALPSSPSSLYGPQSKASSAFSKGQAGTIKPSTGGHDRSRGLLQWVHSISLASVSIDHSLQLVLQSDLLLSGGTTQGGSCGTGYLEGLTPVKSLSSTPVSYMMIPSPSTRFLPQMPLQIPTCLTAESPPLAHLLHSKGFAIPLSMGFVVSKAVPSMRKDSGANGKEEWPSVISVGLMDHYGLVQEKASRGTATHAILENVAAELHALSWMTVSPAYLERRTCLPFHCDMVLRLRRLLHFADKGLSQLGENAQS